MSWVALLAALRAAVGIATGCTRVTTGLPREALGAGLAFLPLVGLATGVAAASAAVAVARLAPALAGPAGVAVLAVLSGARPLRGLAATAGALLSPGSAAPARARRLGLAVTAAVLGVEVWTVASFPPAVRTTALAFASMLGTWAVVVQCYGGTARHARGLAAALVGRARFQEFGWASLVALGVALGTADALGLVAVLAAALTTVGVRLWAHRAFGGMTGRALGATRQLVELAVVSTLAGLAR